MAEENTGMIDFGIDLGTTTSSIAKVDGNGTVIIPNKLDNKNFVDSAVYIKKNGTIYTGYKAKTNIFKDPKNGYAEFKLRMGSDHVYEFEKSGIKMTPVELSAEILKTLKQSAYQLTQKDLKAAVITVPADFDATQMKATNEAAELAGFEQVILLQEPTAAAMAYGFDTSLDNEIWLIYDFGGGTFDVSIMQKNHEGIKNINNQGDAYLGGKLIDWDIVDKIFVPAIVEEFGLTDFNRNNPKYQKEFAKLKSAAELAKIEISNFSSAEVFVENIPLAGDDFEYDMEKEELDELMKPYVDRTINHCKIALSEKDLTIDDVTKIILVGGSTLSPYIHERLTEEFNIPLEFTIDPTTVVARGAAIYAGTKPIDVSGGPGEIGKVNVSVKYEPMDLDDEFDVMGTISTDKGPASGYKIEFINTKTKSPSGQIPSNDKGIFMTTLFAEDEEGVNVYEIKVYDANGVPVELDSNSVNTIKYQIKAPSGGHILSHTIGLGLIENKLLKIAEKGTELPYEFNGTFKTTTVVNEGNINDRIYMPLYEGNHEKADRNTEIGELIITGEDIVRTLPEGSEIELTVIIDESMDIDPSVYIEILDQDFDRDSGILVVQSSKKSHVDLENKFEDQMIRYEKVKKKSRDISSIEVDSLFNQIDEENIIDNIQTFLETSITDPDALDNASKRINDFTAILDQIEEIVDNLSSWDEVKEETDQLLGFIRMQILSAKPEIQNFFNQTKASYDHAVETKNLQLLIQVKDQFTAIFVDMNRIEMLKHAFGELATVGEFTDQIAANNLIKEGNSAIQRGDWDDLQRVLVQLNDITKQSIMNPPKPPKPEKPGKSGGSKGGYVDLG